MSSLKIFGLAGVLALALVLSASSPGAAHDPGFVAQPDGLTYHNCHEVAPFVEVDYAAADALVPSGYTVFRNASGNANLFLNGISCESIGVGGVMVPNVIESHMSVVIRAPYPGDGAGNTTDSSPPCTPSTCPAEPPHESFVTPGEHEPSPADAQLRLESYIVQWITNSPEYAAWMRHGTGLEDRVVVVPGLFFDYNPQPAHEYPAVDESYFFRAPPPAPSPFHVGCEAGESACSAVVTEPAPEVWEEGINWWADTAAGSVIIHSEFHLGPNQKFGTADGTVTSDDPNSEMGVMFAAADDANNLSQTQGQPPSRQMKRFSFSDPEAAAISGEFTDIQLTKCVRNASNPCSAASHAPPDTGGPCTAEERTAMLRDEQAVVVYLAQHYGPGIGQDLTFLDGQEDMAALAAGDPESGTAYNLYDHAFVSFADMGLAILNTGDNGVNPEDPSLRTRGKPDLLLYAPSENAADVTDPSVPDFPYALAGWAYSPVYDYPQHPAFLGHCITRWDWFVHERGIHPASCDGQPHHCHDWGMVVVPPAEGFHGEHSGQDPILPHECDDPQTSEAESCPAGIQHGRIWDIHIWRGESAAAVSMLRPQPIAGIDPEVGVSFFYPEGPLGDADGDRIANNVDNCPTAANSGQQNGVHPGTPIGDHCEDPELDGVYDLSDNCPDTANASQENFDNDANGDACDPDDDNDRVSDSDEPSCGGANFNTARRPERVDGLFVGTDDDGDTEVDEALPAGAAAFDCDGDGYKGSAEDHVFSYLSQTNGDQKTCQEYDSSFPNPAPHVRPSKRWPSDIASGSFSGNKINVQDLSTFINPVRYLNQDVGTDPNDVRFDLVPGSTVGFEINVADMAAMTTGASGFPSMLGGARAFNGPICPYAP